MACLIKLRNCLSWEHAKREDGYFLFIFLGVLGFVTIIITTFFFARKEQDRWQLNYTLGQQFAQFSRAAHHYAQNAAFDDTHPRYEAFRVSPSQRGLNDNLITLEDLIAEAFLPSNFQLPPRTYQGVEFFAYGVFYGEDGPFEPATGTMPAQAIPSALTVMDITAELDERTPLDVSAFRAGAASKGFFDIAIPQRSLIVRTEENNLNTCRGDLDVFVSWSDNRDDCMSEEDLNDIAARNPVFTDTLDPQDALGYGWEAALAKIDQRAVMRRPQPGVPFGNVMSTGVGMDSNNIIGVNYVDIGQTGGGSDNVLNVTNININSDNPIQGDNPNTELGRFWVDGDSAFNGGFSTGSDSDLIINDGDNPYALQIDGTNDQGNVLQIDNGDLQATERTFDMAEGGTIEVVGDGDNSTVDVVTSTLSDEVTNTTQAVTNWDLTQGDGTPRVLVIQGQNNGGRGQLIFNGSTLQVNGNLNIPTSELNGGALTVNVDDEGQASIGALRTVNNGDLTVGGGLRAIPNSAEPGGGQIDSIRVPNMTNNTLNVTNECYGQGCPDALGTVDPGPGL